MRFFAARDKKLPLNRTLVMGILNVTPDSFSDGGLHNDVESAVRHARLMKKYGADIIDIGGQSTRPGYTAISCQEEMERIIPVIKAVSDLETVISVDTFYPEAAKASLEAGAHIINDVSGFADPKMIDIAAEYGAGCIVMHCDDITGVSGTVEAVSEFFKEKTEQLLKSEISRESICLDPGIGFGKTYEQNLLLLKKYDEFSKLGFALMAAASRKRVIGKPCGDPPFDERDGATIAAHTIAVFTGANILRVHDVKNGVYAAKVADAVISVGE